MKAIGKVMLTPKGDYSDIASYTPLDLVRHNGASWISLKEQTGVEPTQDDENWQLIAQDGSGGDMYKSEYDDPDGTGVVNKARELENASNDTLKAITETTIEGKRTLLFDGEEIGGKVEVDDETIVVNDEGKLALEPQVSAKISKVGESADWLKSKNSFKEYELGHDVLTTQTGSHYTALNTWGSETKYPVKAGHKVTLHAKASNPNNLGQSLVIFDSNGNYATSVQSGVNEDLTYSFENDGYVSVTLFDSSNNTVLPTTFESVQLQYDVDSITVFDTYNKSNAELTKDVSNIYDDGFASHNFLNPTLRSITANNITCTYDNGTYTLNGRAEGTFYQWLLPVPQNFTIPFRYKITGCPSGGSESTYRLGGALGYDDGNGSEIYEPDTEEYPLAIIVNDGTLCENLVFKPMIVNADKYPNATYDDFEPYAKSNVELTRELENRDYDIPFSFAGCLIGSGWTWTNNAVYITFSLPFNMTKTPTVTFTNTIQAVTFLNGSASYADVTAVVDVRVNGNNLTVGFSTSDIAGGESNCMASLRSSTTAVLSIRF